MEQQGVYPKDKTEVEKFVSGMLMLIHSEQSQQQMMQQLSNENIPIEVRIGNAVSQIVTVMLAKVKKQSGRKPNIKLILNAIQAAVKEIAAMAKIAGFPSTPEQRKKAAGIAGDLIESGQVGGGQQQQQSPEQPEQMQQPQPEMQQGGGLIGGRQQV